MINPYLLTFLLCLTLNFSATAAQHDSPQPPVTDEPQKYYDVEIIVFKFNDPSDNGEVNLPTPSARRGDSSIDFNTAEGQLKAAELGFSLVPNEEYRLQPVAESLTRSSRYTILTHQAWRQPGLEEDQSIPVWITGGRIYGKGYSSIDQVLPEPSSGPSQNPALLPSTVLNDTTQNQTEPKFAAIRHNEFYELDGLITIVLSRYLHTQTQLVFRKPANPASVMEADDNRLLANFDILEEQLLYNYGLNESRRMRSQKLHYLDNPYFGLLVIITPYEAPETVENSEPQATTTVNNPAR